MNSLTNLTTSRPQAAYCFYCACQNRLYSQGHVTNAQLKFTATSDPANKAKEAADQESQTEEPLFRAVDMKTLEDSEEVRKLHTGLEKTTGLLDSLYSKKKRRVNVSGGTRDWTTCLQTFDVRFNRGSQFLKNIPAAETQQEISAPPAVPKPALAGESKGQEISKSQAELVEKGEVISKTKFSVYEKTARVKPKVAKGVKEKQHTEYSMSQLSTLQSFNQQMIAYVKICAQQGKLDTARSVVNGCLLNTNARVSNFLLRKIVDIEVPNTLLHAYSNQGLFEEAWALYQAVIDSSAAVPNIATFIWLLRTSLGSENALANSTKVLDSMTAQSLLPLLESAANHPSLRAYPAAMSQLREDMMSLHPNVHMEPRKVKPDKLQYSNVLVNELNEPKAIENPSAGVLPMERVGHLLDDHMASEQEGLVEIESVVPVHIDENVRRYRCQYRDMINSWKLRLEKEFSQLLLSLDVEVNDEISSRFRLSEFLRCLPAEQIVSVMVKESERLCEMSDYYSPNLSYLALSLGKGIRCKYISHVKSYGRASELEAMHRRYMQAYNAPTHPDNFRSLYEDTDESSLLELTEDQVWPDSVANMVGEALYKLILGSLTVPAELLEGESPQPVLAFYTVDRYIGVKRAKQVKPHPNIITTVKQAQLGRHLIDVDCVPMIIPPVPWRVKHRGPFLLSNNALVRSMRGNYFGESSDEELLPVFDALNVLGAVPWKINGAVYPHLLQVFNSGGDAKLKIPISEQKVVISDKSKENLTDEEVDALLKKSQAEAFSERVSFDLALSVANHFKNGTFWMPHDVDFRGRAYPISRYLSQVSSDPLRSILTFAKGQPLGERGLNWLKIHLVNLSGFKKKESTATRLAYAEEVLPLALQSAACPLEGEQWWQTLDSPWQGLAACMELKAALDSGDPVNYLSTLPIHQDGSCNGLQHYAALGGDMVGASAVNLLPSERPHDTYQDVANRAELCRARDAANGNPIAQMLEGHITRKVVKQTVMTKVYGVTQYGSKLQIHKHLSEQSPSLGPVNLQKAAAYLSSTLFESMASMFISSTEIQNWLTLCAHELTTTLGKPVSWKTPLGLSVTQNYWTNSLKADKLGQAEPRFTDLHHDAAVERPDVNKNRNGFPPNFIHSLDASHMMLTALRCHRHGITFASIHDCFWTHANSIDTMNKMCRESFYDLHSQPILAHLSDHFVKNYINPDNPDHEFIGKLVRSVIPKGSLDLSLVKKSEYFFS